MKIHVTDFEGVTHDVSAQDGWPVMEIIKAAGLPIKAECGGCCLCSTCHVYVDDAWVAKLPGKTEDEEMTLSEAPDVQTHSRLSCQLRMCADLDGLRVTLGPTY